MATIVRKNERSWAIDLISKINSVTATCDLKIKRAGGESTISTGHSGRMFPDVLLYGNLQQTVILQGWELKMPDVPIEDETFIKDAQRKALALNLNSCLIWNFTYAVLYVKESGNQFTKYKEWNKTSHIKTRADVETYRSDWESLIEEIIIDINQYFVSGKFRDVSLGDVISDSTITSLVLRNKALVAEYLKAASCKDSQMDAYIRLWWSDIHSEYECDEKDMFSAYAKSIILNWANRLIFAHIIKYRQNGALIVNNICSGTTIPAANEIFQKITENCDFYNIFSPVKYSEILPEITWQDFGELADFLNGNRIEHLDQTALQNILEGTVSTGKREINGQFTTPVQLSKMLARLTVKDWSGNVLDCCCGTGTIAQAVLLIKKSKFTTKDSVESVWACDKNSYPLQLANISMTDTDTIHIANRLFQHNALTLTIGEEISITNPESGEKMQLSLPKFRSIVSNLPFVPFEKIPKDDKEVIFENPRLSRLDSRSDLYSYIAVKIGELLEPGGRLGVIVSNSWLGTNAGDSFVNLLLEQYFIRQIHISGKGRWFKNADVVATILILEKKAPTESSSVKNTSFWLWKRSLEQFTQNPDDENALIDSALLDRTPNADVAALSSYSQKEIKALLSLGVSYNALFHQINWLLELKSKIVPISKVYRVFRGSRRGWDPLFYPKKGEHKIEGRYLKKVLLNARDVEYLSAVADRDAFCCSASLESLADQKHNGALEWINRFASQKNGVGKPLPDVLKRKGMHWYEMKDNEVAEVFTIMNPDQRLFFARFETPSFVNQRLIGLVHTPDYSDTELCHALINSMLTMFFVEASGFGRGLGVLDVNKDKISKCYMLDPKQVSPADRKKILNAFQPVKARKIMKVSEELHDASRIAFERAVLKSFGIDSCYEQIKHSLLSMQGSRATARE